MPPQCWYIWGVGMASCASVIVKLEQLLMKRLWSQSMRLTLAAQLHCRLLLHCNTVKASRRAMMQAVQALAASSRLLSLCCC